ncbi:MAG: CDP-alcohol phosphatidyltransferase family protein [Isosphaerales bacterium]
MSSRAVHLVIDARPRGPRGLLAAEVVLGRSVLGHLLDLAVELASSSEPVVVHAREEEHRQLRELAGGPHHSSVVFVCGPPRADAAVLRTDCFYDAARLRRGLRRGRSPESAVMWRLDRPGSLATAEEELTRRLTYQPLGKYWAFPLAERLAERLCPTSIRPNALTLATAALMLSAAGLTGFGANGWIERLAVALCLSLSLVLDTADGRLARLQGTSSALGRWLDQVLDELADLALHAAIAWAAFVRDGRPIWLALGILYASGKYLFLIQSLFGNELERAWGEAPAESPDRGPGHGWGSGAVERLAGVVRTIGHADVRWHLWIVLGLVGRLDVALAVYASYFAARAVGGAVRKGVRYA